jgi:hypothetical protein
MKSKLVPVIIFFGLLKSGKRRVSSTTLIFLMGVRFLRHVNAYLSGALLGANVIKLLQQFFMVNYSGKKTLLFLGLKYCGNLLSYCSNFDLNLGRFDVINIPVVI